MADCDYGDPGHALYARAERDRGRYQTLVEKREISRSDYDARETEAIAAAETLASDRAVVRLPASRLTLRTTSGS